MIKQILKIGMMANFEFSFLFKRSDENQRKIKAYLEYDVKIFFMTAWF
jgi:hypothetical protein